jgi:hypothetical protein
VESNLFLDFTRKLVAVPKKEIDEQLKLDREKKQKKKDRKRK